jgi:DNA-binding response OmpR family regulator
MNEKIKEITEKTIEEVIEEGFQESFPEPPPENVRRKLIYVDDVSFGLISFKNRLKDRYEVFPAQSVDILFEILQNITPDLILLDVKMPGTDGYEAIHMLKEDARYAEIPVVFVTSQSDKESVVKSISLGAVGHICKPFSTELLIETIEHVFDPAKGKHLSADLEADDGRPCILAIDDVSSMLRAIHYALRGAYKVHTLSRPEDLKETLREVKPDLFLLDYKMPTMNGFELVPIIRELPGHKDTPIIFLTSEGTADHLTVAVHLGACDYIVKPFDPKILHERIAKHLKRN